MVHFHPLNPDGKAVSGAFERMFATEEGPREVAHLAGA
jgi:hypothetical protein